MRVVAKALGISVLRVMKLASLQMPSRIGMVEALSNMKVMRLHGMDHGVHDGSWNGRSHGDDSTWGLWTRRSSWWSNSAQGGVSGWYETPQGWFWGESLDQAVQYGVARGWIQLDSAFCAWWHGHAESAVGKKHGNGEKEDSKSESDSRGESASGEQSGSAVTQKESFEKKHAGKEKVPEHDGELTMREYERRVRIFQSNYQHMSRIPSRPIVGEVEWSCMESS